VQLALIPLFLIESPKFYVYKKDDEKAKNVLKAIYPDEYLVEEALVSIKQEQATLGGNPYIGFVAWWKTFWHLQVIGIVVAMSQQLSGVSAIISWSSDIFNSDLEGTVDTIWTTIMGFCFFAGSLLIPYLVSRFNLRNLFLWGIGILVFSPIVLGIFLSLNAFLEAKLATLFYALIYSATVGSTMYILLADLLPPSGFDSALSLNSTVYLVISVTFVYLSDTINDVISPFYFYSLLTFVSLLYLLKILPDTQGKTLNDILIKYKDRHSHKDNHDGNMEMLTSYKPLERSP